MSRNDFEPLMTVADVAAYLSVGERKVRQHIAEKTIPFAKVGGAIRFRRSEIDEWIETQSIAPVTEPAA